VIPPDYRSPLAGDRHPGHWPIQPLVDGRGYDLFTPRLPRRVRLRLWRDRRIDASADWLIRRRYERLAILLWRAFRLW
jgi:hypothetical protein